MKLGKFEVHPFAESTVRFDGGAMFGHVPKSVWNRLVKCDRFNRVLTACNSLLVKTPGRTILVEAGMGTKWSEKARQLYDLQVKTFREALAPFGVRPEEIDTVLLSHLHIDHAGGLTEWDENQNPRLVFPNATVYVQKGEWLAAHNPDPRSVPSYRPEEDLDPVEQAGKLHLLEGDGEIFPGVSCEVTGGHTAWHQILRFESEGEALYYLADIFPSPAHLKPHWVMGFDLIPLEVMRARARLLPRLKEEKALCLLGHAPENPLGRIVEQDEKDRFVPIDEKGS